MGGLDTLVIFDPGLFLLGLTIFLVTGTIQYIDARRRR